jgi:hypothetical protein
MTSECLWNAEEWDGKEVASVRLEDWQVVPEWLYEVAEMSEEVKV